MVLLAIYFTQDLVRYISSIFLKILTDSGVGWNITRARAYYLENHHQAIGASDYDSSLALSS